MPTQVYTTAFTVGSDQALPTFNADFVREAGSGTDELTVDQALDRLEARFSGSIHTPLWASYRYNGASSPTGDQEVLCTNLQSNGSDTAYCGVTLRHATGADTCYFMRVSGTGEMEIVRRVAGVDTVLASGGTIDQATDYTVTAARAVGTGATVDLTFTITGEATVTYADTNAARLTSGQPGVELRQSGSTDANDSTLDNLEIWDLAAAAASLIFDLRPIPHLIGR